MITTFEDDCFFNSDSAFKENIPNECDTFLQTAIVSNVRNIPLVKSHTDLVGKNNSLAVFAGAEIVS